MSRKWTYSSEGTTGNEQQRSRNVETIQRKLPFVALNSLEDMSLILELAIRFFSLDWQTIRFMVVARKNILEKNYIDWIESYHLNKIQLIYC